MVGHPRVHYYPVLANKLENFVIGINRLTSIDMDDALSHIPTAGNSEKAELPI